MLSEVELHENGDGDGATLLRGAQGEPSSDAGAAASSRGRFAGLRAALAAEPLLLKTMGGVVLGIVVGAMSRIGGQPSPRAVELIGFPGELFMRMLRCLVLPLVSVSMVNGVCSLSARSANSAKRVATRLVGCYIVSTLVACALGLAVVSIVQPGVGVSIDSEACGNKLPEGIDAGAPPPNATDHARSRSEVHRGALDSILTTARAAVPANVVAAAADGNILGVISASLMFGAALAAAGPDKADPLIRAVHSLNYVIEVMVGWAIALMPPGVLSLVAGRVAAACNPVGTLAALGKYVLTVLLGLGIHGGVVLPGLYTLATARRGGRGGGRAGGAEGREGLWGRWRGQRWSRADVDRCSNGVGGAGVGSNEGGSSNRGGLSLDSSENGELSLDGDRHVSASQPIKRGVGNLSAAGVLRAGAPAMITAFATDSSSAALPVTRRCACAMGVPDALADFALPLGRMLRS